MKVLLLYSSRNSGPDPVIPELFKALGGDGAMFDICENLPIPDGEFDITIAYNALEWYAAHRLILPSRSWNCVLSFCFADLTTLLRLNAVVPESGVQLVITNCSEFVRQISAIVPSQFSFKPLVSCLPTESQRTFGCVLPNVEDRDFSQLIWTFNFLEELQKPFTACICLAESEKRRLPAGLQRYILRIPDDSLFRAFGSIKYFVPAPRITDYRGGIIPPEIIEAAAAGSVPLIIKHPLLESISSLIPMYESLTLYEEQLRFLMEEGTVVDKINLPSSFAPAPKDIALMITRAHVRWMANAQA